jgi:hypothetical protein
MLLVLPFHWSKQTGAPYLILNTALPDVFDYPIKTTDAEENLNLLLFTPCFPAAAAVDAAIQSS